MVASTSGRFTSKMLICTSLSVIFFNSSLSLSTSCPPLPMIRPGRAVQTVIVMSLRVRSITIRDTLAFARRALRYLRSLLSSSSLSPYFLPPYQLESHPRIIPKRLLIGFTFCPIRLNLDFRVYYYLWYLQTT